MQLVGCLSVVFTEDLNINFSTAHETLPVETFGEFFDLPSKDPR